jgi:hypothetical protein
VPESTGPASVCSVADCDEPAVVTPRSPTTTDVVAAPPGEIVPLCADHAEEANAPEVPPEP